jgi:nucleoside-diphosphate-sugar epimerase
MVMNLTLDRVMVTGGAGFIGSHTVDALLQNGLRVLVFDDLSTGSLDNLKRWKKNPRFRFHRASVVSHKSVDSAASKVDAIIHLAAIVSPHISLRKPEVANEINVSGTLTLLRAALRNQVKRVVFASSSSVYGNPKAVPTRENAQLAPMTPYGVSKLAAEEYCRIYSETYGLGTISLRYFNVYGDRQASNPYSGVIAIFMDRLKKGLRPMIFGRGNQTRDFVHVSDVVRANLLALGTTKWGGEVFNIGTGRETSITNMLRLLRELMGKEKLSPAFSQPRPGDISHSCANIAKARKLLGFTPKITLREGLKLFAR